MKAFRSVVSKLADSMGIISGISVGVITLIITVDVGMRYLFNNPLIFAFETCEYLLVVAVFFSFGLAFQRGRHLRIEVFTKKLPFRVQYWNRFVTLVIGAFFSALWTWQIGIFIYESYLLKRRSQVMRFPIWIPEIFMFIGALTLFLVVFLGAVKYYKNRPGRTVNNGSRNTQQLRAE